MEYKLFEEYMKSKIDDKLKPLEDLTDKMNEEINALNRKHKTVGDDHRHVEIRTVVVDTLGLKRKT